MIKEVERGEKNTLSSIYKLLYILNKINKLKGPIYSTRNYIQIM